MDDLELKANMSGNHKTLNVMAATSYNTDSSNKTIKYLRQNFDKRTESDREVWLYGLDISMQDTIEIKVM